MESPINNLPDDGRKAEREFEEELRAPEREYQERRDVLYSRLRDHTIHTVVDWSEGDVKYLASIAQEVASRGEQDELTQPQENGGKHRQELFKELLDEARRMSE